MKKKFLPVAFLCLLAISFTSCEAIGGLMKASFWTGAIIVIIVVVLVIWLIGKAKK